MFLLRLSVTLFVIFISFSSSFALEPVVIDKTLESKKIGRYAEYFFDQQGSLTIEDLLAENRARKVTWIKSEADKLNFGYCNTPLWMRFTFANPTGRDIEFYLQQAYAVLDYQDLYVIDGSGKYTETKTGYAYPFHQRPVEYRSFMFPITIKAGSTITCYFRCQADGSLNVPLSVVTPQAFRKMKDTEAMFYWMYVGIMCVMFVYNLIIFLSTGDRSYLYYVLHIVSIVMFLMTMNGMARQYLWPDNVWIGKFPIVISMVMIVVTVAEFAIKFIDIKKISALWYKLFRSLTAVSVVLLLFILISRNYVVSINITNAMVGFATLFCTVTCIYFLFTKRSRQAVFFLSSFFLLFAGGIVMVLQLRGMLPENIFTSNGVMLGSVVQVVMLSLGLADRINTMKTQLVVTNKTLASSERLSKERAEFLEKAVTTIKETADELISVSRELSNMGENFSEMSHDQATSSEEMSSTFEELASSLETIKNSTLDQKGEIEKTMSLMKVLQDAQESVSRGNQSVMDNVNRVSNSSSDTETNFQHMITMMNVLNEGGTQIGNFSSVIDDISDKINLLSLNAAIEAARAGEYGRGFAVVADEIGKLAGATSDNSRQISQVISKITTDIVEGIRIVDATKMSTDSVLTLVKDINLQIQKVNDLVNNLKNALNEVFDQSINIGGYSKNIADATIEQSASMEQTISMVERLSENAQKLQTYNERILSLTSMLFSKVDSMKGLISSID